MSVRRLSEEQPVSFEFSPENKAWAEKELTKYPPGRQASAVLALLWRAQLQNGFWLPRPAIEKVASMLDMPNIRALEIATFYTMFNLAPVGRHYVQLCGTTPCALAGADEIKAVCRMRIGEPDHVSPDGLFSWTEVECLGACCNAPMVQINEDYYEDLTPENFAKLLDKLAAGQPVKTGSQTGRLTSEPTGGLTTLTSLYGADGRSPPSPSTHANDAAPTSGSDAPMAASVASPPGAKAGQAASATPSHAPAPAGGERPPGGASVAPPAPSAETSVAASSPGREVTPPASAIAVVTVPQLDEAGAHAHAAAEEAHISETLAKLPPDATPEQKADAVGARPLALPAPRDRRADDLQRIKGVGPVNEKHLHDLGVFHFDQIAAWARAEIRWVGTYLAFPGRVDREQWVAQAAKLASGGRGPKDDETHGHPPTGKIGN